MGTSTFSNYTVVPEIAVAKIRKDAPFDKVCYIGCGVTTGIGAVINTAKVQPGDNVVVFGLGGIGLNVIQGARLAGANLIVGVDINPERRALAEQLRHDALREPERGRRATWCRTSSTSPAAAPTTPSSASATSSSMRQALECCHKGWGTSVIIGVAGAGEEIATRPVPARHRPRLEGHRVRRRQGPHATCRRSSTGTWTARSRSTTLITHTLPLADINHAFDLMHDGESIRTRGDVLKGAGAQASSACLTYPPCQLLARGPRTSLFPTEPAGSPHATTTRCRMRIVRIAVGKVGQTMSTGFVREHCIAFLSALALAGCADGDRGASRTLSTPAVRSGRYGRRRPFGKRRLRRLRQRHPARRFARGGDDAASDADARRSGRVLEPVTIDQRAATNPAGLDTATVQKLKAGGAPGNLRVLYPYDGTVFPRGLLAPPWMWDGGSGEAEAVYVHIKASKFEYQGCLKPTAPGQLQLPKDVWDTAGKQTQGPGDPFVIQLSTLAAGAVSGPAQHALVIAQATIKGSIFYNSYSSVLPAARVTRCTGAQPIPGVPAIPGVPGLPWPRRIGAAHSAGRHRRALRLERVQRLPLGVGRRHAAARARRSSPAAVRIR